MIVILQVKKMPNINDKVITGLDEAIAYKEGKKTLRVTEIDMAPVNVKTIRKNMHLSQQEFSNRYGFPVTTVRNWEQGHRTPEGAAQILLKVIEKHPEVVENTLRPTHA